MYDLRITIYDLALRKRFLRTLSLFALFVLFSFFVTACVKISDKSEKTDSLKSKTATSWRSEDEFYTIYCLQDGKIKLTDVRPLKSDTAIFLCIPAAFTQLDDGSIDGLFMVDGKIKKRKVNTHLGGGMLLTKNSVSILKTDDSKLLDSVWVSKAENDGNSFFQQIQLVRGGQALEFKKDQKLFQRRAICIYTDNSIAVIESKSPLTLQDFADDLVKMKVKDAIYTDMGSYDEGWVRNTSTLRQVQGPITVIGHNRMETAKQSNWVVFSH